MNDFIQKYVLGYIDGIVTMIVVGLVAPSGSKIKMALTAGAVHGLLHDKASHWHVDCDCGGGSSTSNPDDTTIVYPKNNNCNCLQ